MIDKQEILDIIAIQFNNIINANKEYYNGYTFLIEEEQQFLREKDKQGKKIFLVVKLLPATINFGQTLLPIIIEAVSERNSLDICHNLMISYAEVYNLTSNDEETIKQYYSMPSILSNFNAFDSGYRSLLSMTGTFQITENQNNFKIKVNGENNDYLPTITSNISFNVQLETNGLFNQDDITSSKARVGTTVINFTMYFTNTDFCNKVLGIWLKDKVNYPDGLNTDFNFDIVFTNGLGMTNQAFKLNNFGIQSNLGELVVASFTFTI